MNLYKIIPIPFFLIIFIISCNPESESDFIKPNRLEVGDTIAFCAPSGFLDSTRMGLAKKRLIEKGFHIVHDDSLFRNWGYLAGKDEVRANELMKYFGNVENRNNPLQLIFETSINKKSLLLDSSGEAKRMQIEFKVNYSIFKVQEYKELVYSNTVNVFNTYTLSSSEYNNSRAEIKTYDLIAKEIGSIIANQISINYLQLMD